MEGVEILDTVARDGLPGKEMRQCEQWGCLSRGSGQCKGPETMGLVRLRSSQEACVGGEK